jgi:hypothetical protein
MSISPKIEKWRAALSDDFSLKAWSADRVNHEGRVLKLDDEPVG